MGREHDHGEPHAVDVQGETVRGLRKLGLVLLVVGALLTGGGVVPGAAAHERRATELACALELARCRRAGSERGGPARPRLASPGSAALLGELG